MFTAIAEKHTLISLQVWSLPLAAPIAPWLWLHTAFEWKPSMTSAQFIQNDKYLHTQINQNEAISTYSIHFKGG